MTRVTSLILMTHVDNHRLGALGLDLEGRDERIFGVDPDAIGVSFQPEPDGEMHRHLLGTIARPQAAPSAPAVSANFVFPAPNVPKIGGPPQAPPDPPRK